MWYSKASSSLWTCSIQSIRKHGRNQVSGNRKYKIMICFLQCTPICRTPTIATVNKTVLQKILSEEHYWDFSHIANKLELWETKSKLKPTFPITTLFHLLPRKQCRGTGNRGCGQSMALHLCHSFMELLHAAPLNSQIKEFHKLIAKKMTCN